MKKIKNIIISMIALIMVISVMGFSLYSLAENPTSDLATLEFRFDYIEGCVHCEEYVYTVKMDHLPTSHQHNPLGAFAPVQNCIDGIIKELGMEGQYENYSYRVVAKPITFKH